MSSFAHPTPHGRRLEIDAGLGLPAAPEDAPLRRLLARSRAPEPRPARFGHWPASFFGLERVRVFREASPGVREAVLDELGRAALVEAHRIEKVGIGYAAKMVLLAETIDARLFYARMGAEEASHYAMLSAFAPPDDPPPPFLCALAGWIEGGDAKALQLVVQIALEGLGLTHYRALRGGARTPALAQVFDTILHDEAAHHGSGLILIEEGGFGIASRTFAIDALSEFLKMIRVGPVSVLATLERYFGPFSARQRNQVLEELEAERHAAERLVLIRRLLDKTARGREVAAFVDRLALFTPQLGDGES